MKKIFCIFWLTIIFMTKAIAFQNPACSDPTQYFQEIAARVQPLKYQVQLCYEMTHDFMQCNGGINGISPDITVPNGNIAYLSTKAGVITVLPVPTNVILPTDSYILTPSISHHTFSWTASGDAVEKGYTIF